MYIVVLDQGTMYHSIAEDSHGFVLEFTEYPDARDHGEMMVETDNCSRYHIYGVCTDERNHIL